MNDNIVLIGMPGAGKSTIGVLLAKALGKSFVDTDLLIQQSQGRLLQDIINTDGISAFLKIEEDILIHLAAADSVVATGGSAVYSSEAMNRLKSTAVVIYLHLTMEAVEARIRDMATRGIVLGAGQTLEDLYRERVPLYDRYADLTVECSHHTVEQTVQAVANAYRGRINPV